MSLGNILKTVSYNFSWKIVSTDVSASCTLTLTKTASPNLLAAKSLAVCKRGLNYGWIDPECLPNDLEMSAEMESRFPINVLATLCSP